MIELLEGKRQSIAEICTRFGGARLEVFGSALGKDFNAEQSDLDLLVELKPMQLYARVDAYFGIRDELRVLLNREIELVIVGAVKNPYISREIERTKQLLYVA
jgi:predicted nucleotidyltransferase